MASEAFSGALRETVVALEYLSSPLVPFFGFFKRLSRTQKAFVFSTIFGVGAVLAVGRLLKRSKRRKDHDVVLGRLGGSISRTRANYRRLIAHDDFAFRGGASSVDGLKIRNNSSSICSDQRSTSTLVTLLAGDPSTASGPGKSAVVVTAQQLGLMGLEALETAIGYWEDAELAFGKDMMPNQLALASKSEDELFKRLQVLLEKAYKLQDEGEALFLHQGSLLFSREGSIATPRPDGAPLTRTLSQSSEGGESFHSAMSEMSDELLGAIAAEGSVPDVNLLELYRMALTHYQEHGIPTRGIHTEMVGLTSDDDYRVKVHCLRLGFTYVFEQDPARRWFADAGSQILNDLFIRAQKDPREVLMCFEEMVNYLLLPGGRRTMVQELKNKGYPAATFFDVILENLLEAFGHLEDPPAFVLAVTNNRWLSSRFKESALAASLWSLIRAKKSTLESQEGYLSRYYDLMAHAAPVVVWGFLGTEPRLNQICNAIKDEFTGYIQDIFSFRKVQYTKVEDLAQDLWRLAKQRYDLLAQRLAV